MFLCLKALCRAPGARRVRAEGADLSFIPFPAPLIRASFEGGVKRNPNTTTDYGSKEFKSFTPSAYVPMSLSIVPGE